jgi:hypothetical protein
MELIDASLAEEATLDPDACSSDCYGDWRSESPVQQ